MAAHPHDSRAKAVAAVKDILSGTVGGFAQVAVGHPLDTVKIRLQATPVPGVPPPYTGMIDCCKKIFAQEGIAGLYKGALSPIAGALLHNAGLFLANGQAKEFLRGGQDRDLTLNEHLYAGFISGFLVTIVEAPIDLLKIKPQAQLGTTGEYAGVMDAARKITSRYGIRGLYQGLAPTLMRNTPAFGFYFWGFEAAIRTLGEHGKPASLPVCFAAGGFAGFCFWGVIYPTDIIKTRMQSQNSDPAKRVYSSTLDCIRKTYAQGGVAAFYRGYVPAIVRAVPVNAAIFLGFTITKRALAPGQDASSH